MKPIPFNRAILQLHKAGTRLCQMHERGKVAWYLVPGGPVTDDTATKLIAQPNVVGQHDALFPGHHQTWAVRQSGATPHRS